MKMSTMEYFGHVPKSNSSPVQPKHQMEHVRRRPVEGLIGNFLCHGVYYCPGYMSEYQFKEFAAISYSPAKNTNGRKYILL